MHFLAISAGLAATAGTLAFAAPTATGDDQSFTVQQVASGKRYLNGPIEMLKTYQKYASAGAAAPADVVRAAAAAKQSGSVTASPLKYDEAYLCPVTIGGQHLTLDFDTGSADLWVFSTLTPSSEVDGQTEYDPANSTTAKKLAGYTWDISYGDGSGAKGVVYSDKVVVGGVTATSQAVEAATSVSTEFTDDTSSDGLLGLAFSKLNTVSPKQKTTFFDTVKSTLQSKLFTANLLYEAPGTYGFGYIDTTKYSGDISYVEVNNEAGYWGFTASNYSIGSLATNESSSLGFSIADTGTTLLYLPTSATEAYYAQIKGASYNEDEGGYVFSCSITPPDFLVTIGAGTYTIPGKYLNYAPINSKKTKCFGAIQSGAGFGFNIFGDIFLKSVFAVFDETKASPRLGFAAKAK